MSKKMTKRKFQSLKKKGNAKLMKVASKIPHASKLYRSIHKVSRAFIKKYAMDLLALPIEERFLKALEQAKAGAPYSERDGGWYTVIVPVTKKDDPFTLESVFKHLQAKGYSPNYLETHVAIGVPYPMKRRS